MDRRQDVQELLGRLDNTCDSMEEALGHVGASRTTTDAGCSKPT